jgi:hypothetical protein
VLLERSLASLDIGTTTPGNMAFLLRRKALSTLVLDNQSPRRRITPRDVYYALDGQQRSTVQGMSFSLTFAVEVDDLSITSKLNTLTSKFIDTYFPGVRLGWLIDPINKMIYTFMSPMALSNVVRISGILTMGILAF